MALGTDTGTLLEREAELDALTAALGDAMSGAGGLVVVQGAPGVGKSALLRELQARAGSADARVLSATGGELERDFPYGMVRQLLEPVVMGATEERRAELLSGAAELAAPIVAGAASEQDPGDASYAVLHGLYWLVASLADAQPLVLVLEDLHWADAPTLRFLDFLARRARDLPLLMVLSQRPREPGAEWALLDSISATAGEAVLKPKLLSAGAVEAMVAERLGGQADAESTAMAYETTGGNPLLLRELIRSLEGGEVTAETVRAAVPSSVTHSVQRRLDALPDGARQLAASMAVLEDGSGPDLARTVASQEEREAQRNLDTLREAELLAPDSERFLHPLIRQAVADTVEPGQRDGLHQAAAAALRNRPEAADQLVLHLLAAPPTGERWVVELLVAAARRASADGAPEAAVRRLRRAIEEGADDPQLLLELGVAGLRVGDPAAPDHLAAAAAGGDPVAAAEAAQVVMSVELLAGAIDMARTVERLRGALERLPEAHRASDAGERLRGTLAITLALDTTLSRERRSFLSDPGGDASDAIIGARAFEAAANSGPAEEIVALSERAWARRPFTDIMFIERQAATLPFGALFQVDGSELADRALHDAEDAARRHGSRDGRAIAQQLRGAWHQVFGSAGPGAEAHREAAEIHAEQGMELGRSGSNASLAWCLVQLDRLDEAEELLREVPAAAPEQLAWTDAMPRQARAHLRRAQGRPAEAVADLEVVQRVADALGYRRFPVDFPGVELALALAAADRREEATALAREEVEFARSTERTTMLVASLTALGVAEGGEAGLDHLREATEHAARSRSPLYRAQAFVEAGAAVRRAGHRTEARELLRRGFDEATKADARRLQNHAREELIVAGGKPKAAYAAGVDSLTPSERRVSELAAQGLTNRQIAETLFVTQKTVEVHLGHTYGKLEIRSRTQLAEALDPGGAAAG